MQWVAEKAVRDEVTQGKGSKDPVPAGGKRGERHLQGEAYVDVYLDEVDAVLLAALDAEEWQRIRQIDTKF